MKNKVFVLLCVAILPSCAVSRRINTPSGKPEITFPPHVSKQKVRDVLVEAALSNGYEIRRADEYTLVFGQRMTQSLMHQFLLGSRYDRVPEERVTLNMVDTPSGVRAIVTLQYVTNPGSAFERITDMTNSAAGHKIQEQFDQLMRGDTGKTSKARLPTECQDERGRAQFPVLCKGY